MTTSIFSLLTVGSNAIMAQNSGVAVAGKNISNVNTEGYQRELADIRNLPGAPLLGGVRALAAYRLDVLYLSRREERALGSRGSASSQAQALAAAEQAVGGQSGADLVEAMSRMWGGFINLSAAPLDLATRTGTVNDADRLAATFRRAAADLKQARLDADTRIGDLATQASGYAAEIAAANKALVTGADPVTLDKRDLAARKLAELIGGEARIDPDGMMRFVIAGGEVIVDGERAATISAAPSIVPGGFRSVSVVDGTFTRVVTAKITSGRMGGELKMRDVVGAQAVTDLDTLATNLASSVNAAHSAGVGLDGVGGRNLFTNAAGGAVTTADDFVVNSAILGDARLLAAAAAGMGVNSGNNATALALANLRTSLLAGGGLRTGTDEAIRLIGAVGLARANAERDLKLENTQVESLAALRDSMSGVSIEEEMAKLAAFRNASEAAAKYVAVVDNLLATLMREL
jgi:flagellar hook-associated protein 1 FlgK